MHTVTEVHAGAEALDVVVGATQTRGLGQHVVDACFLQHLSVYMYYFRGHLGPPIMDGMNIHHSLADLQRRSSPGQK